METIQQPNLDDPSFRESGSIGNIVRNVRGWFRRPTKEDRAYMDSKICDYFEIVDASGVGSEKAQEFRDKLKTLPWGIRPEILRLCDMYDRRHNGRLSSREDVG